MTEAKNWSEERPPLNTVIHGHYGDGNWQPFKTCRRGCCVYDSMGDCYVPPLQWRLPATPPSDKD